MCTQTPQCAGPYSTSAVINRPDNNNSQGRKEERAHWCDLRESSALFSRKAGPIGERGGERKSETERDKERQRGGQMNV